MTGRAPRGKFRRTIAVFVVIALGWAAWYVGRPLLHLGLAAWNDRWDEQSSPSGFVDDASRLNQTAMAEIVEVAHDPAEAERQLAAALGRARETGRTVAIAGSRHTLGGHVISPDGILLDMRAYDGFELLEVNGYVLRACSGATWSQIIPYLDERRRSIEVMQSNNSFTVGGSVSANCHGWQSNRPPIASTVLSMRVMQADGSIVRCSREEHRELFSLVLGGYGLFGVILDVDLRVVDNARYQLEQFATTRDRLAGLFAEKVASRDDACMAFARVSVAPRGFMQEAVLNVFRPLLGDTRAPPALGDRDHEGLMRTVFRGSVESDYGKQLRWDLEQKYGRELQSKLVSRNQLLNESVELFRDHSSRTTDIIQEYFVPPAALGRFLASAAEIVASHPSDLLNVTVRQVLADEDTYLNYADGERLAVVMLFSQRRTAEADRRMQAMTQAMIEAALAEGGRYYLPYRLHATREQFERAYPQAVSFFELKRQYDPDELFQNQFYRKYGRDEVESD